MFTNVLIGLKEGVDPGPILTLASSAVPIPAALHLVTLVRIGNDGDEPGRLRNAEKRLEKRAEGLRTLGYEVTHETGLVVAAAAVDLLRIAEQRSSELIVIGLAKRSRVGKALMGSDAQRVLLGAGCPVLVSRTAEV